MSEATPSRITATLFMPAAEDTVEVHAVRIWEEVSQAHRFEVDFDTSTLDVDACRGADVMVVLQDIYGHERTISGMVDEIQVLGTDEGRTRWRVVGTPRLRLLDYRYGFRIFQEQTVVDIAKQVIATAELDEGLLDVSKLKETYPERDYVVQYDESEWDFLCRLFEESGIWFVFQQDPDGHTMVLQDDSTKAEAIEPIHFQPDPLRQGDGVYVWNWVERSQASVGKATLNDYNPMTPSVNMLNEQEDTDDPFSREWYEFPGRFADPDEGKRLTDARLQSLRSGYRTAICSANSIHIGPGVRTELFDHPFAGDEFFTTRVYTDLRLTDTSQADPLYPAGPQHHRITLELMPTKKRNLVDGEATDPLLYRPPLRTPRPRIFGLQTARVTGPEGEEVYCDEYGRVKVQFHWDLDGELDDKTTCWIRVGQSHTTGSIMIPRIGWEVLVEFEDGNPDRPLVLGKLYNPLDPPAYELPAFKNVTGIRSESSPGRGGVNEIKFDDTAGQELLAINAQYDYNIVCANNKMESVGNISNRTVGADRSVTVSGDDSLSITNNHLLNITGCFTTDVGAARTQNVSGGNSVDVGGDWSKTIGGMEFLMVGSPGAAVIQFIAQSAISAAVGKAAGLMNPSKLGQLPLIGPAITAGDAALKKAQDVVGPAAQLAGPAAQMLAPDSSFAAATASAVGGVLGAKGGAGAIGQMATGILQNKVAGVLAKDLTEAVTGAEGSGGGGGSAGGASDGLESDGADTAAGIGNWATVIGGDATVSVGAASIFLSMKGIDRGIGGNCTEMIGAARLEAFGGGKAESISIAKAETVAALYTAESSDSYSLSAKAFLMYNVATAFKVGTGKGYVINGSSSAKVKTSKSSLKAKSVSLMCGPATKVVISSKGIEIQGAAKVTLKASKIIADPPTIMPG